MAKPILHLHDPLTGQFLEGHGLTQTDSYHSWESMVQRCTNPKHRSYPRYGAKGITVCMRWLGPGGFLSFLADLGERPSRNYTLDRFPDQKGNYEPGNVRWATKKEQTRNRKSNRRIEFQGKTLCISEWAELLEFPRELLYQRLRRHWSVERALTTPVQEKIREV